MPIADTHSHLYWEDYKHDLPQVLQDAQKNNIGLIINVGVDLKTSQLAAGKNSQDIKIFSSVGLHPHEAINFPTDESIHPIIGELENIYNSTEGVVGIGECGLDYHFSPNPGLVPSALPLEKIKKMQKGLYKAQIGLAKKLRLPLIIHCRDAWGDIFLPDLAGATGLFHSFTGTYADAQKALNLGFYLSFSCMVTYPKNEQLRQILAQTPIDRILTETDCPFLPPQQIRGKRNEPKYVTEVVKVISQVKDISYEEAAKQTLANAQRLFKINSQIPQ